MADMISSGGEGRRSRWVAVPVGVALVVGGLLYADRHGHRDDRAVHQAPPPVRPSLQHHVVRSRGLGLYTTGSVEPDGETLTRIDLASGVHQPVAGVPRGLHTRMTVLAVRGGALVTAGRTGYLVRGVRTVRRFPLAGRLLPDGPDSAWQSDRDRVRRIAASGRALTGWHRLPASTSAIRGVPGGLLLQAAGDRTLLWDPATGGVRGRYGHYLAATDHALAWADSRCWNCVLRVTDLRTRATHPVRLPVPRDGSPVAVSPDGAWVAVLSRPPDANTSHTFVVHVADGRTYPVPDSQTEAGDSPSSVTFSTDSANLIISTSIDTALPPHTWIALWAPGSAHPQVVARDGYDDAFVAG